MAEQNDDRYKSHNDDKKDEKKDDSDQQPKKKPAGWPWVVAGVVLVVFVATVLVQVFAPHPDVWTDDAYVSVHYASVSPRISGQVTQVLVDDNQIVKAGQLLVQLDPRDNEAAVAMAEADLERDTAQVVNADANIARQPALIAEQEAQLESNQARLGFAQSDQRRYTNLASTGAGTTQEHQQADTTLRQSRAAVDSAQAALDASRRQLAVLQAQKASQNSNAKADQARLDQARLNLSYTRILSPVDGMVGQRTVQVGNTVTPGSVLMAVVPLSEIYVTANYREVDLRHVRPGQHVTIHVDAYDMDLDGTVLNLPPASGAAFSPIPPNNATGNFTKIVQRLPVKIVITPGQRRAALLRVGFSVETTIHTALEDVVAEQDANPAPVTDAPAGQR